MTTTTDRIIEIYNEEYQNAVNVMAQSGHIQRDPIRWGGFNRRKTHLGLCKYSPRNEVNTIELSINITRCDEYMIRETIRHELAHAIAGVRNGHNQVWQMWSRKLGNIDTSRTAGAEKAAAFVNFDDYKYYVINTLDGSIVCGYHRRPTRDFSVVGLKGKPHTVGKLRVVSKQQFNAAMDKAVEELLEARKAKK